MALNVIKEKRVNLADKIVDHLKCTKESNEENGDTRGIKVAEKITNELCRKTNSLAVAGSS
jgi:hypothetical protein